MSKALRSASLSFVTAAIFAVASAPSSTAATPDRFWQSAFSSSKAAVARLRRQTVAFSDRYKPGTIVISFGDRRLYYITRPGQAISYPIGVPIREEIWSGTLPVTAKRVNPGWTPTPSMRRKNPKLPAHVPGGHPRNPLGVRALYLGDTLYRIHGTDAPWTIGRVVSQGCIRLYNEDVIDLYERVRIGAQVVVTQKRILMQ